MRFSIKPECAICGQHFDTGEEHDAHPCQVALRKIDLLLEES